MPCGIVKAVESDSGIQCEATPLHASLCQLRRMRVLAVAMSEALGEGFVEQLQAEEVEGLRISGPAAANLLQLLPRTSADQAPLATLFEGP